MRLPSLPRPASALAIALYGLLYAASLIWLGRYSDFDAGESLGILLVFGLGLSAAAWFGLPARPPTLPAIPHPRRQTAVLLLYLAAFAVLGLGIGFSALRTHLGDGRLHESVLLAVKFGSMVLLPAAVLHYVAGDNTRPPMATLRESWRGLYTDRAMLRALGLVCVVLLALEIVVGRGPGQIALYAAQTPGGLWKMLIAIPFALLWMIVEAGLTEEYLFRVLLQTRLKAWWGNDWAAILGMSVLFGLAHAPGYVLRGAHLLEGMTAAPDPLTAAAYAVAVVSPLGILFGVIWARTGSLALLVVAHGVADLVPNLVPFLRTWWA